MHSEMKDLFCPVCKQSINRDTEALQRMEKTIHVLTLGRTLPALLHDTRHSIDAIRIYTALLEDPRRRILTDAKAAEVLKGIKEAVDTLANINSSLVRVCRPQEEIISLGDLAEGLQAILRLYNLRNISDVEPLKKSNRKVHRAYLTVFSFLLQSILIELSRSMRPEVEIHFKSDGENLYTNLLLQHEPSFIFVGDELELLNAQVDLIGGKMTVNHDAYKAIIKLEVPLH